MPHACWAWTIKTQSTTSKLITRWEFVVLTTGIIYFFYRYIYIYISSYKILSYEWRVPVYTYIFHNVNNNNGLFGICHQTLKGVVPRKGSTNGIQRVETVEYKTIIESVSRSGEERWSMTPHYGKYKSRSKNLLCTTRRIPSTRVAGDNVNEANRRGNTQCLRGSRNIKLLSEYIHVYRTFNILKTILQMNEKLVYSMLNLIAMDYIS